MFSIQLAPRGLKSLQEIVSKSSILHFIFGLLAVAGALLLVWPGLAANLFEYRDYMPHGHCYLWKPELVWLHFSSDLVIGLSYVVISCLLAYLVHSARRDIPFHWVILSFGLFIISCGFTHFMEVYTLWYSTYWFSGYIKLITAVASLATAIVLPPLIPKTLALVQTAKLSEQRRANLELANEQLGSLYKELQGLDELKTQFFANVSHELRTPISLILGPVQSLLHSGELTKEQTRSLEIVEKNGHILLKHVNDLLDLSKLEAGRMTPIYSEVNLVELLRLTASYFEPLSVERQIDLTIESSERDLQVELDLDKMQRVFLNLLSNAFKFTPVGGVIRLKIQKDAETASIHFADSGPGIAEEFRPLIFERFQQADASTTRRFGGTGLGLSIAKEFIELHNGSIRVEKAAEGGALFIITLPLRAPEGTRMDLQSQPSEAKSVVEQTLFQLTTTIEQAEGTRPESVKRVDPRRPKVLVVEDNPDMSRFLIDMLTQDYSVLSAPNGIEGFHTAVSYRPDLIISDVMMPQMTGEQMMLELRKRDEFTNIPILFVTAKADDELRVKLLQEGAQDYLLKPFSPEELRARIGNHLSLKRSRDILQTDLSSREDDISKLAMEITERRRELTFALDALQDTLNKLRAVDKERTELLSREREARQQAEDANRLKDEFLATLSHEMRTPLNAILGWSSILVSKNMDPQTTRKAIEIINRNAKSQLSIVNDILDVSGIVTGRLRLSIERVKIEEIVTNAIESIQPAASSKSISIKSSIDPVGTEINADPHRLHQIIWNILSNAVKFTDQNGSIFVNLQRRDRVVEIVVKDTGLGIDAEFLPYVFDRFRQGDSSTTRAYGGLGLGLSIVKNLVEMHGGSVSVFSEGRGKGAEFTIRLPIA
jgi:signal transduction histidine kinase